MRCVTTLLLVLASLGVWLGGGCPQGSQCEPAMSAQVTSVAEARLPAAWCRPESSRFRVVVATGPYRVSDAALANLVAVMREQAGLAVEVVEGADTGLPAAGLVGGAAAVAAGQTQIPPGHDAVLVVVVVDDTDYPGATYGFIDYGYAGRPTAVTVLHRAPVATGGIGPIPADGVESATLVHEVGHWLGVPARGFHTSALDGSHCTNARCVMFKGSRVGPCAILANLCTGVPVRFCEDCAAELAEMRRRRAP